MSSATAQPVGKGGFIANVPLGAGAGQFVLPLDSIPDGNVGAFSTLIVLGGAISTGAAFKLSVTGAPGDDLNLIGADIIQNMSLFLDNSAYNFNSRLFTEVRAACIALREGQDWGGGVNGLSIPISTGTAISVFIPVVIPEAVAEFVRGGQALGQGSARFKSGGRFLCQQIKQADAGLVLANGTLAFTSWQWMFSSQAGKGPATFVGPHWCLDVVLGYPNSTRLDEETWLVLAADYSPATLIADGVQPQGITVDGQDKKELTGPTDLASNYTSDHPPVGGGVDVTQYFTPLDWMRKHEAAHEFPAPQRTKITIIGISTVNLFMLSIKQASGTALANVSQMVGAGGPTAEVNPPIVGTEAGSNVPASQSSFLPVIIAQPGSAAAAAAPAASRNLSPGAIALKRQVKNQVAGNPAAAAAASQAVVGGKKARSVTARGGKIPKRMRR